MANPSEDEIAAAEAAKSRAAAAKELRGKPGATKDGHLIPLLANVGKPSDAAKALEYGAEGVGLFRTEFLFIGNSEPPSVEEQTKAYTELLSQFPGKKVVIRMLDAGADKPLPFLTPEDEPNPALGLRGLRTLRAHMDVLEGQLKALAAADAATDANLWVMAPMVADQHEADYFVKLGKSFGLKFVRYGRSAVDRPDGRQGGRRGRLRVHRHQRPDPIHPCRRPYLGSVANYQTAWHPAVLRAIKMICDAGNAKGMPVGVCGEAAADPDLAVVLAGLGVNSLSVTPVALDDVRAALAEVTFEEAKAKAGCSPQRRLLQAGRVISPSFFRSAIPDFPGVIVAAGFRHCKCAYESDSVLMALLFRNDPVSCDRRADGVVSVAGCVDCCDCVDCATGVDASTAASRHAHARYWKHEDFRRFHRHSRRVRQGGAA